MPVFVAGAYTALVTPFDDDGSIAYSSVARLLAWHEAEGMTGVVLAGTNGEGPSLSGPEKRDLVDFGVKQAGRLKVVAGLGTCSVTEAAWLARRAEEAGACASLAIPPFYFRSASSDGIETWFRHLLDASRLPCIAYNHPMTGVQLEPSMIARLFDSCDQLIGIKDSSGSRDLLDEYLAVAKPRQRHVLVGDETLIQYSLAKGGSGTISGLANSVPRLVAKLVADPSDRHNDETLAAADALKKHPAPAVHKHVLTLRGLPGGALRPPLSEISTAAKAEVREFVESS